MIIHHATINNMRYSLAYLSSYRPIEGEGNVPRRTTPYQCLIERQRALSYPPTSVVRYPPSIICLSNPSYQMN